MIQASCGHKINRVMMKYYFCDCEESMRLHEDGKLGDWAKREDIEKALRTSQDSAECPDDCKYKKGRFCLLGTNHCTRMADDYYIPIAKG